MRAVAKCVEHGERLLEPSADRALIEIAARFAVARIVEARHRPAILLRPSIQCLGLRASHVGLESAEPEQAGSCSVAPADGDLARRNAGSNIQGFEAKIVRLQSPQGYERTGCGACLGPCGH